MRVKITDASRKVITLAELPAAKAIVKSMKEEFSSIENYVRDAIGCIGVCDKVFSAEAEIAKNSRIFDQYEDRSGTLDVWIEAVAKIYEGSKAEYVEIGAYLSDIWSISDDNKDVVASHFYVRRLVEVE